MYITGYKISIYIYVPERERRENVNASDSVRVCFLLGKLASGTLIATSISNPAVIFEKRSFRKVEITF